MNSKKYFVFYCIGFLFIVIEACKKNDPVPPVTNYLKVELDMNGISTATIDSAFVIVSETQQRKKTTFTLSGTKAIAELQEVKTGQWNLEIVLYTTKDNQKIAYKLLQNINMATATQYQYQCPVLPSNNMKTVDIGGWNVYYLHYPYGLDPKEIVVLLPYFSDNPKIEIVAKNPSDWGYVYIDRSYYQSPNDNENYSIAGVAHELYEPLPFQSSILTINQDNLQAQLSGKNWNKVQSLIILSKKGSTTDYSGSFIWLYR